MMPTWWIDRPAEVAIDGDGAKIKLSSGDQSQEFRMSRHLLRRMVEEGRLFLIEAEAKSYVAVIEMRGSGSQDRIA